jgi:hypothetical protein
MTPCRVLVITKDSFSSAPPIRRLPSVVYVDGLARNLYLGRSHLRQQGAGDASWRRMRALKSPSGFT